MPIMPILIRLLGASAPNTDEGTMAGNAETAPSVAAPRHKKSRRVNDLFSFINDVS
jgi:hypothetical protein